jgi:hypothetical protein
VADGGRAGEAVQTLLREDLGDEPHGALGAEHAPVGGDDAARLLPAVLELVEAEVGEARRLRVPVDAEHAALVSETVSQLFAHSRRPFRNTLKPSVTTL